MPFFNCDTFNCGEPSVRGEGVCFSCNRHLCATHLLNSHACLPDEGTYRRATEKEIEAVLPKINVEALRKRVMSLRNGISCSIPPLNYDTMTCLMGGMNYHIPLDFDDGVTWICRIRRTNVSSPPSELQNRIILSEAATLRFLASTMIPVPIVHDFAIMTSTNPVGVGYIVMDKLKGRPLPNWSSIPVDRRKHILRQFVRVFVELEKNPFFMIGSLQDPGNLSIGPLVAEQFADFDKNSNLQLLGPFKNAVDYRLATVRRQMGFVTRGEVHHTNAIDSYLVHRYLLELAPAFSCGEQCSVSMYYLKHMDDKGDHILVDHDYNITGIIDWEWAQTMPKGEAFAAPMFLLDVGAYYDGKNELSEGEKLFASMLAENGHKELMGVLSRRRCWRSQFALCDVRGSACASSPPGWLGCLEKTGSCQLQE